MASLPVGGLMPPLSSQLKVKPNDAWPVNTTPLPTDAPGGKYPPPTPVHAVSTTARMPAATSKINRRRKEGAPVFINVLQNLSGARGRADVRVHDVGDFPGVQGPCRAEQTCGI